MLIRALIVLLIALNLGTAAWWLSRPASSPAPATEQPPGVSRLQLLSEQPPAVAATPAAESAALPVTASAAVVPTPAETVPAPSPKPVQCFSLGPFADAAAAYAATQRIAANTTRVRPRQVPGGNASGYNVTLPPVSDRAAAQALAQRIGAAGFDDYLIINSGAQANGIALGRYRSRESAERRQTELKAAGFPALVQPAGSEGAAQWWLDLIAAPGTAGPQLRALASTAQANVLDCAALR